MFIGSVANAAIHLISAQECAAMQVSTVLTKKNPVGCSRLRRVSFNYINFNGTMEKGSIVVLDAVAKHTEAIFLALLQRRFPIHKAVGMEPYHGDDQAAMADNNTSAFNGRAITGGTTWSKHAYGVAIDINPIQNPYLSLSSNTGTAKILPAYSAEHFINRRALRPNKDPRPGMAESVLHIFAQHGFLTWGGEWDSPIDYQHFEIGSDDFLKLLILQSPQVAYQTFNQYVQRYNACFANSTQQDLDQKRIICIQQTRR
jgi:D-alanyl-D-alanine carboxypeptidase